MSDYVSSGLAGEIMQQLLEVITETVVLGDAVDSLQARYSEAAALATQALSLLAALHSVGMQYDSDWGYSFCISCGADDAPEEGVIHRADCKLMAAAALLDSPEAKRLLGESGPVDAMGSIEAIAHEPGVAELIERIVEVDSERGMLIDVMEEEGE